MISKIVIKRYAEAFVGYVKESVGLEKALEDLKALRADVIRDNPDFLSFLENKELTFAEKCDFIDKVMGDNFAPEIKHFIKLLIDKGRIAILSDVIEYIRINYSYGEQLEVLLKTSTPLDLALIKKIKDSLSEKLHKKLKFYIDLDGSLLGGIQVTIGNKLIDGSVRKRLDELKEKLLRVRV
ncbi:MAG: ATP synthase F1 subunit delta [Candidatus Omnitrophota bacterium]|jgi:F-type H+-transporting ATPase subunit delta